MTKIENACSMLRRTVYFTESLNYLPYSLTVILISIFEDKDKGKEKKKTRYYVYKGKKS